MALSIDTFGVYLDKQPNTGEDVRLSTTLDAALANCVEYTRRNLTPGAVDGPQPESVVRHVDGSLVQVPDLRELDAITVTSPDGVATIDPMQVEQLTWSSLPTTVWLRLPSRPRTRVAVTVTGRFGITDLPAHVEDSIYTFAARRWRERDSSYADTVQTQEGAAFAFFRQMPPAVKLTWDQIRIPDAEVSSVRVSRG